MALRYIGRHSIRSFLAHARGGWEVHVLKGVQIVLLDQSHVFLLEFARERGVLVGVASGMVELVLSWRGTVVQSVVVHDHVVGATLEAQSLLVLVRL